MKLVDSHAGRDTDFGCFSLYLIIASQASELLYARFPEKHFEREAVGCFFCGTVSLPLGAVFEMHFASWVVQDMTDFVE
nr:hypothetical protein [Arthrobacter sp. 9MFCol3.1]